MSRELSLTDLLLQVARNDLARCNQFTRQYHLILSETEITAIAHRRIEALKQTGRVEFRENILAKLIRAFCDSPYIIQETWADTLMELLDLFYYFKSDAMEMLSDEELILAMKTQFDGWCEGSLALLRNTGLPELTRALRFGSGYETVRQNADWQYRGRASICRGLPEEEDDFENQ